MQRIARHAEVGATGDGGVCRIALTDADREGRDLLVHWMKALDLDVRIDQIGNIFGIRAGLQADAAPVSMCEPVITGAASACKPAPDCYRRGLEKLNEKRQSERLLPLTASECLAIEDSPPGIESARAVGMRTLGITNTVSEDALRAVGADVVTKSLADWTTDAVRHVFI